GLQVGELPFQSGFALAGALVHGLVGVGLLAQGKGFGAVRAGGSSLAKSRWGGGGEAQGGWQVGLDRGRGGAGESQTGQSGSDVAAQLQGQVRRDGLRELVRVSRRTPWYDRRASRPRPCPAVPAPPTRMPSAFRYERTDGNEDPTWVSKSSARRNAPASTTTAHPAADTSLGTVAPSSALGG